MSSTVATRSTALHPAGRAHAQADAAPPRPSARVPRVVGRADRPVLRIVADDEQAPVFTRVIPASSSPRSSLRRRSSLSRAHERAGRPRRLLRRGVRRRRRLRSRSSPPRPSTLRLTRRGRLVVLGAEPGRRRSASASWRATGSLANDQPEPTRVVTVQPGQTLWDIASRGRPHRRRRRPLDDEPPRGPQPPRLHHPPGRPDTSACRVAWSSLSRPQTSAPADSTPAGAESRGRREAARPHARCLPWPAVPLARRSRSDRTGLGSVARESRGFSSARATDDLSDPPTAARTSAPTTPR